MLCFSSVASRLSVQPCCFMPARRCPLLAVTSTGPATDCPKLSWGIRSNAPKCRQWIRLSVGKIEKILTTTTNIYIYMYLKKLLYDWGFFSFFVAWGVAHLRGFPASSNPSLATAVSQYDTPLFSGPHYARFPYTFFLTLSEVLANVFVPCNASASAV